MSIPTPDLSHGVSTGVITTAAAKLWTMYNGTSVDLMVQVEGGLAAGASAVVADTFLPSQSTLVKAGATGAMLSGAMWAWKGDQNWMVWLPVGAASYYASDYAMSMLKKKMAENGASTGRRGKSDVDAGMPEVAGM